MATQAVISVIEKGVGYGEGAIMKKKLIHNDFDDKVFWDDGRIRQSEPVIHHTFNKNEALNLSPHHTDDRFKEAQTVFGQESKDLFYVYSDRLWEWDYDKAQKAVQDANNSGKVQNSASWVEAYLSSYYGKKITVRHILAGWNWSNGFSYWVAGYEAKE